MVHSTLRQKNWNHFEKMIKRRKYDESFAPLFKPGELEHPSAGEIIYVNRQSGKVLCRRWNWRNADFSKITPGTKNLAINLDGMIPAISRSELEKAAEELKEILLRYCGGNITVGYLDAEHREIAASF